MDHKRMFRLIVSLLILSSIGGKDYTSMSVIIEGCFEVDESGNNDNQDRRCFSFCNSSKSERCLGVPGNYSLDRMTKVNASLCRQGQQDSRARFVEVHRISNPVSLEGKLSYEDTFRVDYCRPVAGSLKLFHDTITEREIGKTKLYTLCEIPRKKQPLILSISYNNWCDAQKECIERHGGYLAKGIQANQCEEVKKILKDKYSTATFWTGERTHGENGTRKGFTSDYESTTQNSANKTTGTSAGNQEFTNQIKGLVGTAIFGAIVLTLVCTAYFVHKYIPHFPAANCWVPQKRDDAYQEVADQHTDENNDANKGLDSEGRTDSSPAAIVKDFLDVNTDLCAVTKKDSIKKENPVNQDPEAIINDDDDSQEGTKKLQGGIPMDLVNQFKGIESHNQQN